MVELVAILYQVAKQVSPGWENCCFCDRNIDIDARLYVTLVFEMLSHYGKLLTLIQLSE